MQLRRSRGSASPGPNPRVGRDGDLVRRDEGKAPRVEDGRPRGLRRGGEVQSRGAPSRAIESNNRGPRLRDTPEEEATITSGRDYRKRAAVRETPKIVARGGKGRRATGAGSSEEVWIPRLSLFDYDYSFELGNIERGPCSVISRERLLEPGRVASQPRIAKAQFCRIQLA